MNVITIGIQMVTPATGTSPQQMPRQPANDDTPPAPRQAPPPPGMGKLVDKSV